MLLTSSKHGLDIVVNVTEYSPVSFLTIWLRRKRLDLYALDDGLTLGDFTIIEYCASKTNRLVAEAHNIVSSFKYYLKDPTEI